jgi:hypothetical protein
MLVNTNIEESLCSKKNIYMNSFFYENTNTNFSNCFHIDIHPLYGYYDIQNKYVWSYGFYLYNPFMFEQFNCISKYCTIYKNENTIISYYIVFEKKELSLEDNNNILYKIKNDILNLIKLFGKNKIKIYSTKNIFDTKVLYNLPIIINFNLIDILKETYILVTNIFSQIFCIAHFHNVKVICTQDDVYNIYLSKFFYTLDNFIEESKSKNIEKYLQYLNYFSINDPIDVYKECCVNEYFKLLNITTQNALLYVKNNNELLYSSIYVLHEAKHLYNTILNGITNSKYKLSKTISKNSIICFFMSENTFSKYFLKNSNNPIIAFDDNVFTMNDSNQNNQFCRYYIKEYNTKFMKQNHDIDLFYYSKKINYYENGIIVCILDNSNGLFYNNQLDWFNSWKDIFHFLFKYYDNKIVVKLHKNDENNKYIEKLKELYKIDIISTEINELLDDKIKFCVLNNGSTYIKCIQKGVLVKSSNYDNTKGIYDLMELNIENELDKYGQNRFEIFENLLNQIVSLDNIKNGTIFNDIYNSFPEEIWKSYSL